MTAKMVKVKIANEILTRNKEKSTARMIHESFLECSLYSYSGVCQVQWGCYQHGHDI